MKKLLPAILLALILITPAFGAVSDTNRQKVYGVDSDVYAAIKWLYISEGLALPSTTGPWTAGELDLMLSRLERAGVNRENSELFAFAEDELAASSRINPGESFGFTIGLDVAAEAYVHSNAEDFVDLDSYARKQGSRYLDYNTATPMLSVPFETWIGDNIYGYTSLDIGVNRTLISMAEDISEVENGVFPYDFGSVHSLPTSFYHNILLIPPTGLKDLSFNFPYRGFGSIGGDWWNLSIGRDRLSWGPGESGNFVIGDQIPYHDNARFTAYTDWFKYTFSASSFIHPMNYHVTDNNGVDWFNARYYQTAPREGIRMMLNHRIEFRLFEKVNIALTESIMYQNEEGSIDLMVLSPTVLFHNYYIRGNANSLISLEADWTFMKHWNLYGQIAVDEFRLPGEFSEFGPPSALAYMLGTKFSYPMGQGVLYGSLEGVYTEPYFYLRDDGESREPNRYGNSFAVAFKEYVNADKRANYDLNWVGYRYGGDAVVADLKVGYKVFGSWYAEGLFTYIAHGCFDIYTRWKEVAPNSNDDPSAPSTSYPTQGSYQMDSNWSERNAVSHTFSISLEGGVTLFDSFDIFGRADLVSIINSGNIKGESATDFQFTLGLKYSF